MITVDSTTDTSEELKQANAVGETSSTQEPENAAAETLGETAKGEEQGTEADAAADGDTEDTDEVDEEEPKQPKKKRNGFQRRIAHLEAKIAELAGGKPAETNSTPQPDPNEPKSDDFENYNDYIKALVKHERTKEVVLAAQAQAANAYQTRVAELTKTVPDFQEVMDEGAELPINKATSQAIAEWETGPAIAYHLAKNPELAHRLVGLDPVQTVRELARLEASIVAGIKPATTKPIKASTAPEPVRPLASKGPSMALNPRATENMSFAEYNSWRNSGGK